MTSSARTSVRIRRPVDEVAPFVTDPHQCLPVITGFGRFRHLRDLPEEHHQEWEVFLTVGTLQLGGAVDVDLARSRHLIWRSLRGTRHTFDLAVEPVGEESLVTLEMTLSLSGLLMARLAERVGRGIMTRHLEAAAEELRHHVEFVLP